jgi:hypothetical protein
MYVQEIIRQIIDEKGTILSSKRERISETDAEKTTDVWEKNENLLITFENSFKPNVIPLGGRSAASDAASATSVVDM